MYFTITIPVKRSNPDNKESENVQSVLDVVETTDGFSGL